MEFGLGEGLPLYAGGLGILAGDFLKTASDLGIPVIGIGLLYQEGYFRQLIDAAGAQHEAYPYNDPGSLPIQPARTAGGGWLHIRLDLPGRAVELRVWQALVGRVRLYLLDANDAFNSAADRGIRQRSKPKTVGHELGESFGLTKVKTLDGIARSSQVAPASYGSAYTTVPNKTPTPAVIPIASPPQNVTRIVLGATFAPPARAASAPKSARESSEVPATKIIRLAAGAAALTMRGMAAPRAKQLADASAAWVGRALSVSDMPSSSRACAAMASWAMSWLATCAASAGSRPRPT